MDDLIQKARKIQLLLSDCDGVMTDGGVYYSARGEEMKRFSIRDGMGLERLRKLTGVDFGIMTGEDTGSVKQRAEKLQITERHFGIKDKFACTKEIIQRKMISLEQVAYIGDDVNDVEVMRQVGLAACPADATPFAKEVAHYICESKGGYGALRDFIEFIIRAKEKSR